MIIRYHKILIDYKLFKGEALDLAIMCFKSTKDFELFLQK